MRPSAFVTFASVAASADVLKNAAATINSSTIERA